MKQILFFALGVVCSISFVACSTANKQGEANLSNDKNQILNKSSKDGAKTYKEEAPVSPEGARFVPYAINSEGKANGYRCVSLVDESKNPLSKAGIQVNDIVLAINERELQTAKEASYFFELVRMNQYYSIKIQRGQRIFTLKKVTFTEEG